MRRRKSRHRRRRRLLPPRLQRLERLEPLEPLERLVRLERLEHLERLERLEHRQTRSSFPGSTVPRKGAGVSPAPFLTLASPTAKKRLTVPRRAWYQSSVSLVDVLP